ncbi:MAG: YIP1 family protein [Haloarculaceae archaeon]
MALGLIGTFVRADVFLTIGNFLSLLRNAAVVTIVGYGMTMLITSGEFDLSVGSLMGLGGALMAVMRIQGFTVPFIIVSVLIFAVLYGIVQGLLVTKLGLPSLIVTIGTLTLVHGGRLIVLSNVTQAIPDEGITPLLMSLGGTINMPFDVIVPYTDIKLLTIPVFEYSLPVIHSTTKEFNLIPIQIFWMIVLGAAFHYVLFYTRFGYRTRATGGDEESARLTGIDTDKIKIANFAIVAAAAMFAGMSQVSFTRNASATTGSGLELIVIASVVIGGTDLFGGEGTMIGTVLGALVFSLIQNILVLAGMGTQLFSVLTGAFIIFAIGLDAMTRHIQPGTFNKMLFTPLSWVARKPRKLYRHIDDEGQGITPAVSFGALVLTVWALVMVLIVTPTFIGKNLFGGPILPMKFGIGFVTSDVGILGMLPIGVYTIGGMIYLLTAIYIHAAARALGGEGSFDRGVQVAGYAMAPFILAFIPFTLLGFSFVATVVIVTALPIALAVAYLNYVGLEELYGLERSKAITAVAIAAVLWVATMMITAGELSAFLSI